MKHPRLQIVCFCLLSMLNLVAFMRLVSHDLPPALPMVLDVPPMAFPTDLSVWFGGGR